ncbi:MAG: methyltransferase domain-containing protein [Deltaproteobacteria bacterium]|nr:methyltransferase domain-containing protein [Deltaproteobacteria bacterium]
MIPAPAFPTGGEDRPTAQQNPVFADAVDGSAVWAQFPSGKSLVAERTRARGYPGLASPAPPTSALYRLLLSRMPVGCRALDAGCGAGTGLPDLLTHYQRVVGLDKSAAAIEFARQYCSGAELLKGDLEAPGERGVFDSIFVVDVLGHLAQPFSALRALHGMLADGGRLAVCEPSAYPSQSLRAPLRRAFSQKSLHRLLEAAGFHVEEWVLAAGSFQGCIASRQADDHHDALLQAARAVEAGDAVAAVAAYERGLSSKVPAVRLEATIGMAELHFACNQGDAACEYWMLARRLDSSDPRPLAGLAQLNLAIGDTSQALELAEIALSLDPADPGAACVAAQAAEKLGTSGAAASWRRACNLVPDNAAVATGYARAASACDDRASAIQALERVRQYDDNDALLVHMELARTLAMAGRLADARLEFGVARALAPDHPEVELMGRQLASTPTAESVQP